MKRVNACKKESLFENSISSSVNQSFSFTQNKSSDADTCKFNCCLAFQCIVFFRAFSIVKNHLTFLEKIPLVFITIILVLTMMMIVKIRSELVTFTMDRVLRSEK